MGWFTRKPRVVGAWELDQLRALHLALIGAEKAGDTVHVKKLQRDIEYMKGSYDRAIRLEREVLAGVAQPYD